MKLSEMKQVLAERELKLTKSLGQNFLHDQNQLRRIVAAAELRPADKILEIGPGLGPLTTLLLEKGAEVLAIEKDRRLCDFLEQKFTQSPNAETAPRRRAGIRETEPALGGLETGGQSAVFGGVAHSGGTGASAGTAGANGGDVAIGSGATHRRRHGRRRLRRAGSAGAAALPGVGMFQDSGLLFFPGAGGGFGVHRAGAPARAAAKIRVARGVHAKSSNAAFRNGAK